MYNTNITCVTLHTSLFWNMKRSSDTLWHTNSSFLFYSFQNAKCCSQLTCDDNDLVPEAAVIRHGVLQERVWKGDIYDAEIEVTMMANSGKSPSYSWTLQPVCWGQRWLRGYTTSGEEPAFGGRCSSGLKVTCWAVWITIYLHISLQWRHNGRDSVSNHQPHDCLLNRLFRGR